MNRIEELRAELERELAMYAAQGNQIITAVREARAAYGRNVPQGVIANLSTLASQVPEEFINAPGTLGDALRWIQDAGLYSRGAK